MDICYLFRSCKTGNFSGIQYLVSQKDVELNIKDKWDCTPLYYACLCGHYDIVKYLLQNGALCDPDTFDGERCFYVALTNKIRHLLKDFQVINSMIFRRDAYQEFLRKIFQENDFHDFVIVVEGKKIKSNRCILAARCDFFKDLLWGSSTNNLSFPFPVKVAAVVNILRFIYTGTFDMHLKDKEDCLMLSDQINYPEFSDAVKAALKACKKKNVAITVESPPCSLKPDFSKLLFNALPERLNEKCVKEEYFTDLHFAVHGHVFPCHKVFVCGRCDYFKALLDYEKNCNKNAGQVITLEDVEPHIFKHILYYIYTNTACIPLSDALDVLELADLYLLPGLKNICAVTLNKDLQPDNVIETIKLARLYGLPRLELQCCEYMTKNLHQLVNDVAFQDLVLSDAYEVQHREMTDTISIIDDIRFYISNNNDISNDTLILIDDLLRKLNLEA